MSSENQSNVSGDSGNSGLEVLTTEKLQSMVSALKTQKDAIDKGHRVYNVLRRIVTEAEDENDKDVKKLDARNELNALKDLQANDWWTNDEQYDWSELKSEEAKATKNVYMSLKVSVGPWNPTEFKKLEDELEEI